MTHGPHIGPTDPIPSGDLARRRELDGLGGAVDVLRVPQWLTAAEAGALILWLNRATPQSVGHQGYANVSYNQFRIGNAGEDTAIAELDHPYLEWAHSGAPNAVWLTAGIYFVNARATYDAAKTGGTYRASEMYISPTYGFVGHDEAPMNVPAWATWMGYVSANQTVIIPPGATATLAHIIDHDAGEAVDVTPNLYVTTLARFEELDA